MSTEECSKVIVRWSGKEYEIEISDNDSVIDLKNEIEKKTGVRSHRQKLLNLKFKGKTPEDDCKLCLLKLKPNLKIMMMGSLEEDIALVNTTPTDLPSVTNDLDIEDEKIAIENQEVYLAKIEKRVKTYEINMLSDPRPNKNLLVLDIDYTIFDHKSCAETGAELMRPYLHEFLTSAYDNYDIVIWSATSMKWIEEKMKLLGVTTNPNYKIMFYLDSLAMISVHSSKYGLVKALGVIWGKFKQYNHKNTIIVDDLRRNFIMNPLNGFRIRPFRNAHLNRDTDKELLELSEYLKYWAKCDDFTLLIRSTQKYGKSSQ